MSETLFTLNPVYRLFGLLKTDKEEIFSVYFYAILNGLIQLSLPLGIQAIIGFVLGGSISTSLIVLIFFVIAGVFLNGLLQVNQMKLIEKIQQKIFARYSFDFASRLPKLSLQYTDNEYLPELTNRFFEVISLQKGISKLLLEIPTATIQIIFGIILLCLYHPLFIVFGFLLVLILFILLRFTGPKGMETSLQESKYKYKVVGWLEEISRIVKSIRFSKNSLMHLKKNDALTAEYLKYRTSHFKILLIQYWSLIGFKVLITAAMLIVGVVLLVNQQLNIGQFVAAEIVIITILNSVEKFILNLDKIYDVMTSLEKLAKVIEKPVEKSGQLEIPVDSKGFGIEIRNLSFEYQAGQKVLENISIKIDPSEKVCVSGLDGSGKSTLLKLLTGSYTEYSGSIHFNGIPLGNFKIDSLRSNMGIMISQQDVFQGSLMENITMGNSNIDLNAILDLSKELGIENFLETIPEGFNLQIDPIGRRLSRNTIQKILLLRALLLNPRLLLLEDPWAGLEEDSQKKIRQYLLKKLPSTTVIIITNDDDFMQQCDKIIRLKNGRIESIIYPQTH